MIVTRFSAGKEFLLTILLYLAFGVALIPFGALYAVSRITLGYEDQWTLLVFLGIAVVCARLIKRKVQRWLSRRLFSRESANPAYAPTRLIWGHLAFPQTTVGGIGTVYRVSPNLEEADPTRLPENSGSDSRLMLKTG